MPATSRSPHSPQVHPADVGQPRFARATWLYQVLGVHHRSAHAAHELGFLVLHGQGQTILAYKWFPKKVLLLNSGGNLYRTLERHSDLL